MERYLYPGGQFIHLPKGYGWEEWQGHDCKFTFIEHPLPPIGLPQGVAQWRLLFDASRAIGVALPRGGGQSYYSMVSGLALPTWQPLYQVTERQTPTIAVWAEIDVPGIVCHDARIRGLPPARSYPQGETYGQYGWDMGLQFSSLDNLASSLVDGSFATPPHLGGEPVCPRQIHRLAINAHGYPGEVYVEGKSRTPLSAANARTTFRGALAKLEKALAHDAVVLFMSCNAGYGPSGDALLTRVSALWPGRKVVGFATVGWKHDGQMRRPRTFPPEWRGVCSEPGMRETWNLHPLPGAGPLKEQAELTLYGPYWGDLHALPWASELSPYAKVAQGGRVVKTPPEPTGIPPGLPPGVSPFLGR